MNRKFLPALVTIFVAFFFLLLSLLTAFRNLEEHSNTGGVAVEKEKSDIEGNIDLPEIDWGDLIPVADIKNIRMESRVLQVDYLGTLNSSAAIVCDLEIVTEIRYPLFLAHFQDRSNNDIIRSSPLHIKTQVHAGSDVTLKRGQRVEAFFFLKTDKLSKVEKIKILKRVEL